MRHSFEGGFEVSFEAGFELTWIPVNIQGSSNASFRTVATVSRNRSETLRRLACRTVEGAAAAEDRSRNPVITPGTFLARPIVHPEPLPEVTRAPFGIDEVPQRCSTLRNGVGKHTANAQCNVLVLAQRDSLDCAGGPNTGEEQ